MATMPQEKTFIFDMAAAPQWLNITGIEVVEGKRRKEHQLDGQVQLPEISFSLALHISSADLMNFLVKSSTWRKHNV